MRKLLIANRGEIARRIIVTAKRMGISTVAVCSDVDVEAPFVTEADEHVVLGPAPAQASYLDAEKVIAAAESTGADAIHPGYGFLSENPAFARAVVEKGLTWVGPPADVISLMGDKVAARKAAADAGVPTLAGSDGPLDVDADSLAVAKSTGFPLVIKAAAGGGGRGIRLVESEGDFLSALDVTRAEARSAFGDDTVYLERFVAHARHVEVQVLADGTRCIHLGDRDCSMQRRSQKVLEEAPAPDLPDDVRDTIRETSVRLAQQCGYSGAGTVEFLYDPQRREAAFIEMNTRLQVEHPVTEMITGVDLVEHQLRVADGEPLAVQQSDITFDGHAIECRINAEDPSNNFFPSPGTLSTLQWPEGGGIRVDAGVDEGSAVAPFYDSMVAKLIVRADDRDAAIVATRRALEQTRIEGISTTIALHRALLASEEFAAMTHHTKFIENSGILSEVENA